MDSIRIAAIVALVTIAALAIWNHDRKVNERSAERIKKLRAKIDSTGFENMDTDDLKAFSAATKFKPEYDAERARCDHEIARRETESAKGKIVTFEMPKPEPEPQTGKGYAPANPNARLNRDALDTTPDKVRKAQRKAGLRCPKCGSANVTLLNNTKSSLSAGKAVVGDLVAGAPGMVVGAAMGKRGKREYLCNNCGNRYSVKN